MKFTINLEMEAVEQAVADFLQERFRGRVEVTRVEYLDEDVQFRVTVQEHDEPAPEPRSTRVDQPEEVGEFPDDERGFVEPDDTIEDGGPEPPKPRREPAPQSLDEEDLVDVKDPQDVDQPGEVPVSGKVPAVRKSQPRISRQTAQAMDARARGGKSLAYRY